MLLTARHSMLIPNQWDAEWTDTSGILCEEFPGPPGVGAAQIAMQALGLSPDAAASMVTAWQSASGVSPAALANATRRANQQAAREGVAPAGGRLAIPPTVNPLLQLLAGDPNRVFLLIQNNETTGGATLLISIDPINTSFPAFYLNFPPATSFGLVLDQNVINNPIYAGWSGTPASGGVIFYGSKAGPPAVPPSDQSVYLPASYVPRPWTFSIGTTPLMGF